MASLAQERAGLLAILGLADTGQSQAELLQRLSEGTNPGEKAEQTHLDLMGAIASPTVTTSVPVITTNAASTAGVITPANAVYTVADQTALANAVLAINATLNQVIAALGSLNTAVVNNNSTVTSIATATNALKSAAGVFTN